MQNWSFTSLASYTKRICTWRSVPVPQLNTEKPCVFAALWLVSWKLLKCSSKSASHFWKSYTQAEAEQILAKQGLFGNLLSPTAQTLALPLFRSAYLVPASQFSCYLLTTNVSWEARKNRTALQNRFFKFPFRNKPLKILNSQWKNQTKPNWFSAVTILHCKHTSDIKEKIINKKKKVMVQTWTISSENAKMLST